MDLQLMGIVRAVSTATALMSAVLMMSAPVASAAETVTAWPMPGPAEPADASGAFGSNLSGLAPAGASNIWVVRDGPGSLLALDLIANQWTAQAGWGNGRSLRYPDGHTSPDAEAVTVVASDPAAVYVGAERDNSNASQNRNSVLRYETTGTGALTATTEWRLDDLFNSTGANTGIEGLAWIPDAALTAAGLRDRSGAVYNPSVLAAHRGGLFAVGIEGKANLLLVMLTDDGKATLIATVAHGLASVMELHWNASTSELWAVCDNTCDGTASVLRLRNGAFESVALVAPPVGSASLNDEGFTILPCSGNQTLAVWSDDLASGGHALRNTTVPCAPFAEWAQRASSFSSTTAATPAASPTSVTSTASAAAPASSTPTASSTTRSAGTPTNADASPVGAANNDNSTSTTKAAAFGAVVTVGGIAGLGLLRLRSRRRSGR